MGHKQFGGETFACTETNAGAVPPTAGVNGIDLTQYDGSAQAPAFVLTVINTGATQTNVTLWGELALGAIDTAGDDVVGVIQDKLKANPLGVLAASLPVGAYHFIVEDLAAFDRIWITTGQAASAVTTYRLTQLLNTQRGS